MDCIRSSFVPAPEAAYIGGVSLRDMNRMIDEDLVPRSLVRVEGGVRRFSPLAAAFARFFGQTDRALRPGVRKEILFEIAERVQQLPFPQEVILALRFDPSAMNWKVVNDTMGLQFDLSIFVTEAMRRAMALDRAARLVVEDSEVMGGQPCFAGTRVPISVVLASLDEAISMARLMASYPFLTDAHIEAARIYTAVRPRRGRPPRLGEVTPPGTRISRRIVRSEGR